MSSFWNKYNILKNKKIPKKYCVLLVVIAGALFGYLHIVLAYWVLFDVLLVIKHVIFLLRINIPLWEIQRYLSQRTDLITPSMFLELFIIVIIIILIFYILEKFGDW